MQMAQLVLQEPAHMSSQVIDPPGMRKAVVALDHDTVDDIGNL